ncbi:MAG: 2-oxo acid dehydrogenase subunit E2 [Planctomycetota bacterium]
MDVTLPALADGDNAHNQITSWYVTDGQEVVEGDPLYELATDKVTTEVPAPASGVVRILARTEAELAAGAVIARIETHAAAGPPSAREPEASTVSPAPAPTPPAHVTGGTGAQPTSALTASGTIHRRPLSPLRRAVARRLVAAQHDCAILTTVNEIDMSACRSLRAGWDNARGPVPGYTALFAAAVVRALASHPILNSRIEGGEVLTPEFVHIGIAVGSPRGLVVPVIRNAERLDPIGLQEAIQAFAGRAREGRLLPRELEGGTFSLTNGGVYGSLLSTPLLTPPQCGNLGMHAIKDRPVVLDGAVVARPMMYVALSYDHRLVDGQDAVGFLVRVRESIEDAPALLG